MWAVEPPVRVRKEQCLGEARGKGMEGSSKGEKGRKGVVQL